MEVEGRLLSVAMQNCKKPHGLSSLSILTCPADDPSVTLKVSAPLLIFWIPLSEHPSPASIKQHGFAVRLSNGDVLSL